MQFKKIEGYNGRYEISDSGVIRSTDTIINKRLYKGKTLKPTVSHHGYYYIGLNKNNIRKAFYIHRLVWITFKGKIPPGLELNHKDGKKLNNNLSNLECISHRENIHHARKNGLQKSKFTDIDFKTVGFFATKNKATNEILKRIFNMKNHSFYKAKLLHPSN